MKFLPSSPIFRVAFGIAMLTLTLLLVADTLFGLSTERSRSEMTARKHLAETLAVQYSDLAAREDLQSMRRAMRLLVERNDDIRSTALRKSDGEIISISGPHLRLWRGAAPVDSTPTHTRVPLFRGARRWGDLEIRFKELSNNSLESFLASTWFQLLCFVTLVGGVSYFIYMRRTLRHLDPASVIPERVKTAFDVLAEGVVFIDLDGHIVLANDAFGAQVQIAAAELTGRKLDDLNWQHTANQASSVPAFAWHQTLRMGSRVTGTTLRRKNISGKAFEYNINAAPVLDDSNRVRGAIVTFDDITELERKKLELEELIVELRHSHEEIKRQNEKLEFVATRDPMTNCLNRRAFVDSMTREVAHARRDGEPLTCIMLDIDHFKSVNDTYGHLAGDEAIRFLAGAVSEETRGFDLVCRYGGEEFCVLMPNTTAQVGQSVAERIRTVVEATSAQALPELQGRVLTVSLGVTELIAQDSDGMAMVDRADGALYRSKTSGRNRSTIADPNATETATAA